MTAAEAIEFATSEATFHQCYKARARVKEELMFWLDDCDLPEEWREVEEEQEG